MTHTFVYLHGFASSFDPTNDKVRLLETIGNVIGITYNTTDTYDQIKATLANRCVELDIDLFETSFVGTSLGAYWAAELGRIFGSTAVLINPCYDPFNMLQRRVGNVQHVKTGETITLTKEAVDSYRGKEINLDLFVYKPLFLLDEGDDVISSASTMAKYIDAIGQGLIVVYRGGDHRFQHMAESLDEITKYVNRAQLHYSGDE